MGGAVADGEHVYESIETADIQRRGDIERQTTASHSIEFGFRVELAGQQEVGMA